MATVHEITGENGGRVGGVRGVFGSQGLSTTWKVTTDTTTDDPIVTLATTSGGVRIGDTYPWAEAGVVAIGAGVREHVGPCIWLIDVFYGAQSLIPNSQWNVSYRGALDTKFVETARDFLRQRDVPIGPHAYWPKANYEEIGRLLSGTEEEKKKVSAFDKCRYNQTERAGQYFASIDGCVTDLLRIGGDQHRRVKGMEVPTPTFSWIWSISVSTLSENVLPDSWINTVNKDAWYGRQRRVVKCTEISIERRPGIIEGQPVTGVVFDIQIVFAVNPQGFMRRFADTYESEQGEAVVFTPARGDIPVMSEYSLYDGESNFDDLLSSIQAPGRMNEGRPKK